MYMANAKVMRENAKYSQMFDNIPNDMLGRIAYILGNQVDNAKLQKEIESTARSLKRLKWLTCEFTMWKIVKPSARPRYSNRGGYVKTYVPRARENGDWFETFCYDNKLPFIQTPCIINIDIFEKIPSGIRKRDAVLAEMGIIRPCKRTGDVDNYAKSVLDMIQHGMLADDALVFETRIRRFYSCKPHVDVNIKYMEKWPKLGSNVTGKITPKKK